MSTLIRARDFHQMKGHINEGNQILFSDGTGPLDAQGLTRFIWDREGNNDDRSRTMETGF